MHRLAGALIASSLALIAAGTPAMSAETAGYGIRLVDAPTERRDDPRAQLYVVDHVKQGATIRRRFEVSNGTAAPVTLQLYAAAASVANGRFTIGDGRAENELSGWTTVTPSSVDLAPGAKAVATVQIVVPAGVEDGERYGAVLAEAPPLNTASQVRVGSRVGIRMYLDVGTGSEPASDFQVDSLTARRNEDRQPLVVAQVRNTGGRALDMSGELRLDKGPGGLSAGPFDVELGTTLGVGEQQPVAVTLDKALPAGPWHAELVLTSGRISRGVEGTITFPEGAGASGVPVRPRPIPKLEDPSIVVPVAVGVLGLVALLLLLFLYRRRTRREADEPAQA